MSRFDSVLVANRGEIAVRILRTAREQGYRTIAVYSDADRLAPHVAMADEAVHIGPSPVAESYLNVERILQAARRAGAQAVHPGYGFLSENADFARACDDAGLVFIGPSADAIALMGNKAEAKRRMLAIGVPCIPGYEGAAQDNDTLLQAARDLGLPLMVKAAAGGGGRGMRLVTEWEALPAALEAARSEATNAFGCGDLILERALLRPRHVEVQVFGDGHGNRIHLGERDCSLQRRHQKVVEEAPCPVIGAALRERMGAAALAVADSIDYRGAGTVEFLLDDDEQFYFLEMNTRLQVEHPVTEAVTGLDLVALQLAVAQGEPLPLSQSDVALRGHAIEVRLYAEDPAHDFLPATGSARVWEPPAGAGLRVDHGLAPGQTVTPYYDPLLAKIIAAGSTRSEALRRLRHALCDTALFGVTNNRAFLLALIDEPDFAEGLATTALIGERFPDGFAGTEPDPPLLACAALLQHRQAMERAQAARLQNGLGASAHTAGLRQGSRYAYALGEDVCEVQVLPLPGDEFEVRVGDSSPSRAAVLHCGASRARVELDGQQRELRFCHLSPHELAVQWRGQEFHLSNELARPAGAAVASGGGVLRAPMHGNLLRLRVAVGDAVQAGQELAVIEAMKMEHRLLAEADGEVSAVHAVEGAQVAAGAVVLEVTVSPTSP